LGETRQGAKETKQQRKANQNPPETVGFLLEITWPQHDVADAGISRRPATKAFSSHTAPSTHQVDDQNNQPHNQQQMNQTSAHVQAETQ
jgi:hypothetical protein